MIDTGVKLSIVRNLRARGATVELHPCTASPEELLAGDPDAIFLANGPGDPAALDYIVDTVRELVGKLPVYGICLGHQLLCRAVGLETYKLPFGHHGANHPVKDLTTGRTEITSQNHGFAVLGPGRRADDRRRRAGPLGDRLRRRRADPHQPLRPHGRGADAARRPGRDRPVPPRGGPRAARLAVPVRPLRRGDPEAAMPRRDDLHKILLIGSGPIVIGQAAEFDYSGTQACRVLMAGGLRGRARQLQPGDDHDRPRGRDHDLHRAAAARAGGAGDRARAPRRAAADARRPDGAQPRQGAARGRHARALRRRADRRRLRGDRPRRGPRALPRDDDRRPGCGCRAARSRTSLEDARAALARDRPAVDRAPRVHARRHRRRRRAGTEADSSGRRRAASTPRRSARCCSRSRCSAGASSSSR